MIILDSEWDFIRKEFTEEEKQTLRGEIQGQIVCPRGIVMDDGSTNPTVIKLLARVKMLRVNKTKK